jgi:hypothetical protein
LSPTRLATAWPERDADVLDGVVRVDVQVALASTSRSISPWRAIWSSMWSRKGTPVASFARPVPSRSSATRMRSRR